MKQTAVEWLKKELEDYGSSSHLSLDWETFDELCKQAKSMEKEQITQSFVGGADFKEMTKNVNKRATAYANQYYRNNYRSNII